MDQKTKERFKVIPAVYVLMRRGAEVLLSLRQNTGYADGFYSLVTGHLEGGESASEGLRREIREEIGIDVPVETLKMKLVMHRLSPDREAVDFFFETRAWEGSFYNAEPDKCAGLSFFSMNALPINTVPYIRAALEAIEAGKTYMEYGWCQEERASAPQEQKSA